MPDAGTEPPTGRQWFACYTRSRHEKRVAARLDERGIEHYLPLLRRKRQWKDRQRIVTIPLFPSYVFGRFALTQLHAVLRVPGLSTVVRSNGVPVPIKPADLENVRRFVAALNPEDPVPQREAWVKEGRRVRISGGPFDGVRGIIVQLRGKRRVLVGLEVIGVGMAIDIESALLVPDPSE